MDTRECDPPAACAARRLASLQIGCKQRVKSCTISIRQGSRSPAQRGSGARPAAFGDSAAVGASFWLIHDLIELIHDAPPEIQFLQPLPDALQSCNGLFMPVNSTISPFE
jgi:hypothetical protein